MSTNHQFYSLRAAEARDAAELATLDNVRERHLRAAAAWDAMAARAARADKGRAEIEARKAAAALEAGADEGPAAPPAGA